MKEKNKLKAINTETKWAGNQALQICERLKDTCVKTKRHMAEPSGPDHRFVIEKIKRKRA